jgi:putative oxidoreductase
MRIVFLLARILLGLTFVVFGLNKLFPFIPTGPMPSGLAGQFVGLLFQSHYLWVIAVLEVTAGVLLLVNRYVPLALTLLGPIVVNILMFHIAMSPDSLPLALVTVVLWLAAFWSVRSAFAGLFQQTTSVQSTD